LQALTKSVQTCQNLTSSYQNLTSRKNLNNLSKFDKYLSNFDKLFQNNLKNFAKFIKITNYDTVSTNACAMDIVRDGRI